MRLRGGRRSGQGAAGLLVCLAVLFGGAPAPAQEAGEPSFTPTLFLLGSYTDNEFRTGGEPTATYSFYAEAEIPFTFAGPRWQGGISLNPAWRKYRDLEHLDAFEASVDGWLSGLLSPRTRLHVVAAGARSAQLTALDAADLIALRSDRVRASAVVSLTHTLNRRGDHVEGHLQAEGIEYLDDDFIDQRSYGARLGYGRALDTRLSVIASGRVDRIDYGDGGRVETATPLIGFSYRLAPRTDLILTGGMAFTRGRFESVELERAVDGRQLALDGLLRHRGRNWGASLHGNRAVSTGVALGQPTVRSQIAGAIGWFEPRWRLDLNAGYALNELLAAEGADLVLPTPAGLAIVTGGRVETWSACADAGYRLTRWLSAVGSGRFAHQSTGGGAEALDFDVYRFHVGVAIHPWAGPIHSRRGAELLARYGRAGTIGSC